MFRKLFVATTVVLMLVVMGAAITGCPQDVRAQYEITVQNLTPLQSFAPLLAVTHSNDVFVFREGEAASADFEDFVTAGDLDGLVDVLDNLDAVTDIYGFEDGLSFPITAGDTVQFTLMAEPDDVLTVAAPTELALTDSFAGLDSVTLPRLISRTYYMDSFVIDDGEVELAPGLQNLIRVTITRQD